MQANAMALSTETIALSAETMALSAETMALSAETIALSAETMALSAETMALSVETMALLVETMALLVETIICWYYLFLGRRTVQECELPPPPETSELPPQAITISIQLWVRWQGFLRLCLGDKIFAFTACWNGCGGLLNILQLLR